MNHLEKKLSRIIESMKLENGNSQTICAFLEQYNELKKKYEQNRVECEKMGKDSDKLKHQLMMQTCQFNLVQRERDDRLQSLKQQNDEVVKELNHVLDTKIIELRRSTEQRNAAEQELSLILSEKDTVLKENQKLSDDLMLVMKKANEMEQRLKEEKQALFYGQERLKRDLEDSLKFRDEILKECESLREKVDDLSAGRKGVVGGNGGGGGGAADNSGSSNELMTKSRSEFKSTSNESWSKELGDLEAANRENELLRKQLDKVHNEMMKATVDTELAKSRRDWAITEREKIVCERDSVKVLCDELRKERDTAISDLLAAIRDSESIKKQKDEACQEIEQLKEHLESHLSTSTKQLAGNGPATVGNGAVSNGRSMRWSCALDMDSWTRKTDTEVVDIDISGLPTDGELGLVLDGGRDENSMPGDETGVYVVSIAKDSVCDGKLRPNDCVVRVNSLDCSNVSRRIVLESIRSSAPRCQVMVRRQLMNAMHLYTTQLNLKSGRGHGLSFESGLHIAKVEAGSLAARDKSLAVGDRIISINKRAIDGLTSPNEVLMELDDNRNETAVIVALKQIGQMNAAKLVHNNKMINSCTQTTAAEESGGKYYEEGKRIMSSGHAVGGGANSSNNSGSAASEGGFGGIEVMAMSKSTGYGLSSPPTTSATAAKSTSKLTELLKIIRGKTHKFGGADSSTEDSQAQNEAISLLDSVLNSSDSGKASVKRAKRKKEAKEASNGKSMGTWPRANIIAHENLSGTIVQKPKRERPTLSVFNSTVAQAGGVGAGSSGQDSRTERDSREEALISGGGGVGGVVGPPVKGDGPGSSGGGFVPVANVSSRKNVPVIQPPYLLNRHSVYGTLDASPNPIQMPKPIHGVPGTGSGATQTLSRMSRHNTAMDYERQQLAAMNRMSLNFTPYDQSLFYGDQAAVAALGPMKHGGQPQPYVHMLKMSGYQQQPIPSSYKLAPIDLPVLKPPNRDSLDVYGAKKFHRNECLGGGELLGSGNTSTLPTYMRSSHGMYGAPTTNRNAGPKMLPTEQQHHQMLASPMQSPVTTQPVVDSTGMLVAAASGSISEKSADTYMSPTYHHHAAASIDYQFSKHRYQEQQQQHHLPSREELGTGHYGVAG